LKNHSELEVCEEGANLLSQLDAPLGIVGIAGPYRSGKSYLLNLLAGSQGFSVGHTTEACTQGLWIWGEPLDYGGNKVLLLDTEGSGSLEKDINHDAKIMALAILLSSTFCYNSRGVIDEKAIEQLSVAAHISDFLAGAERCAPNFVWVLRDFHLVLVDSENKPVTAKEYMEGVLHKELKQVRRPDSFRKARDAILSVFPTRDCLLLPRPVEQEEQLSNLAQLPVSSLRPKFLKQFDRLKSKTLEECPVKRILDRKPSGSQLLQLLSKCVESLNQNETPDVGSVWGQVIKEEVNHLLTAAKQLYRSKKDLLLQKLPYEEAELLLHLQEVQAAAAQQLRLGMPDDYNTQEAEEELFKYTEGDRHRVTDANYEAAKLYNQTTAQQIFEKLLERLDQGHYTTDLSALQTDWNEACKEYSRRARGPYKGEALSELSRKHESSAFTKSVRRQVSELQAQINDVRSEEAKQEVQLQSSEGFIRDIKRERREIDGVVDELAKELKVGEPELETLLSNMQEQMKTEM
jgi:hypothetical protein